MRLSDQPRSVQPRLRKVEIESGSCNFRPHDLIGKLTVSRALEVL